jgi:hypothetical protein
MSILSKLLRAITREWTVFRESVRSPAFRQLLLWCLPALILGAIARAALNIHFPYGYFQGDTPDFLVTAERLIKHHSLVIHGKKAFLAPICFTIPFLLHIPALIVIPLVQHLAGLAATVIAGAIVRCSFRLWRWFIVPITTLYTLNPALLWYEHALLAECQYLFCITALCLAGIFLVRQPTLRRFVWLILILFLTAGSRPEGKLFVAFGLGVAALAYPGADWKLWARRMAVMLVCSAGIWMCSRSTQAGLLLYATVIPLAPDVSTVAPGIEPFVEPLRTAGLSQGATVRTKLNTVEKRANDAIRGYLRSIGQKSDDSHISALAQKLAIEAIRRNPRLLPSIATNKFLLTCRPNPGGDFTATSGGFTPFWIYDKQIDALSPPQIHGPSHERSHRARSPQRRRCQSLRVRRIRPASPRLVQRPSVCLEPAHHGPPVELPRRRQTLHPRLARLLPGRRHRNGGFRNPARPSLAVPLAMAGSSLRRLVRRHANRRNQPPLPIRF